MRAILLAALLLAPALAGCTGGDADVAPAAVQTALLSGTVTTASFEPLAQARVYVPDSSHEARTDETGRFEMTLPFGDYLVLTDVAGYVNGAQRARLDGADVALAFALRPVPTQAPSSRTYESHGLYSCGVTVQTGEGDGQSSSQTFDCGSGDPNARKSLDFPLEAEPGLAGIVVEMTWDPVTEAGKAFRLSAAQLSGAVEEEIGTIQGAGYARIVITQGIAEFRFATGGTLRVIATPAGSFLDEESPFDAGVALAQPFTVYVTVFTHAPPPASFSVLSSS